jgi:Flp pilus assembly protein TadD
VTPVLAPAPSRNARCPCGSGKRYKACHGALSDLSDHDAGAATRVREGIAAHGGGRLHEAERAYAAALALRPGDAVAAHNLAVIRMQRGDALGAIPTLEWTVQSRPDDPELLGNLGVAYAAVDRFEAAVDAHRHALALDDTRPGAWSNLGLALVQLARHDEAIDAFTHALAIDSSFAKARWHRAMARLARGDRGGWDDFEARLDVLEPGTAPDLPGVPRYRGGDLAGRTLLVDDEQGYGDTLQCARHVGTLADRGARVIVRARDEIAALLRSARGVAEVVSLGAAPPCDAWLPMMSLPGALGVAPQGDDAPAPYLYPDPVRVAQVRMKLERAPARLRVGLSWAGNPGQVNDRRRSCPLAALAPLLERGDIAWYSLQRHDGEDQIPTVPAAGALRLLDERNDFDGKAALVAALDLVVSVCTSTAHLAGALGRPLFLMLAHVPDWRWGLGSTTTGWYPTARLFRQAGPGDWNGVVRDVGAALDTFDRA